MGGMFTPDVEWRVAGSADVVGRGALLQWHADPARPRITAFTRRTQEFVPMGDYAYESGRTLMTRRVPSDTADRQITVRYTILWKRAPDGTWQIHRYLDNTAPMPPRPRSGTASLPRSHPQPG
jgi:ketosteroid isomerase-like protein